jgi:hypothetical protein
LPLIRKVLQHGNSRVFSLPKSWLVDAEEKVGRKIVAVALEVNSVITVTPVFEKESTERYTKRGRL